MRIRTHTNPLACTQRFEKLNHSKITVPDFNGMVALEIGFGQSTFLQSYAASNPKAYLIGIEARKKAVELMQEKMHLADTVSNVLLIHGNGHVCLHDMFDNQTLDKIFIFHPDPWVKRRHHKRRLISQELLDIAKTKLKDNGQMYISTDVESLWIEIQELFANNPCFQCEQDDLFWEQYATRWDDICIEKQRKNFYGIFRLSPPKPL